MFNNSNNPFTDNSGSGLNTSGKKIWNKLGTGLANQAQIQADFTAHTNDFENSRRLLIELINRF